MTMHPLAGLRILVVEDDAMIAMMIEDMLADCGAVAVGPAARVADALALLQAEPVDGALLDVNLAGERSFPIADALAARGVGFVFVTGYGDAGLSGRYPQAHTLQKPFMHADLEAALSGLPGR